MHNNGKRGGVSIDNTPHAVYFNPFSKTITCIQYAPTILGLLILVNNKI